MASRYEKNLGVKVLLFSETEVEHCGFCKAFVCSSIASPRFRQTVAAKNKLYLELFFKNRQNLPDAFLLEMRKKKMVVPCSFLLHEQNCLLPSLTQLPNGRTK